VPIVFKPGGNNILFKFVQLTKQLSPIVFKPGGNNIFVKFVQSIKQLLSKALT
jgi:hypothetical protein